MTRQVLFFNAFFEKDLYINVVESRLCFFVFEYFLKFQSLQSHFVQFHFFFRIAFNYLPNCDFFVFSNATFMKDIFIVHKLFCKFVLTFKSETSFFKWYLQILRKFTSSYRRSCSKYFLLDQSLKIKKYAFIVGSKPKNKEYIKVLRFIQNVT